MKNLNEAITKGSICGLIALIILNLIYAWNTPLFWKDAMLSIITLLIPLVVGLWYKRLIRRKTNRLTELSYKNNYEVSYNIYKHFSLSDLYLMRRHFEEWDLQYPERRPYIQGKIAAVTDLIKEHRESKEI